MERKKDPTFKEALIKSIGLLFAIESETFTIIRFDTPYIYANIGVLEVAYGEIVDKGVEVTPIGFEGRCDMPTVDWYVVIFPDKQKTKKDSANVALLKNDSTFVKRWDDAREFAKVIKHKFWIDC